ncbi:MAG: caspase family protein [Nitratireductor sp.]
MSTRSELHPRTTDPLGMGRWTAGRSALDALAGLFVTLFTLLFAATGALADKRVALVIGNSAYENAGQLANPANDAADMAATLKELGFVVITGSDLDNRGMRDKVREFSAELRGADTAMLFYAGHAMQLNGENYLAPVDTRIEFESDLDFETIPLKFIQAQMEREAKTILLFLDACRDNPLTRSMKVASRSQGASRGLAEEKLASSGILIAFSTNPGNVALDGKGRNSPFTTALLDNIKRPGVEISTLMTDVRVQVVKDTGGQQTPWINSALLGRFFFNPEKEKVAEVASLQASTESSSTSPSSSTNADAKPSNSAVGVDMARIAALAYDAVKESTSVAELEAFMTVYGDTFYGKLAKIRIDRLKADEEKAKASKTASAEPAKTDDKAAEEKTAEVKEQPAAEAPKQTQVASLEQPEAKDSSRNIETKPAMDPREMKLGIQQELDRLGCNPGRPDGLWGKRSQGALDTFARSAKIRLASSDPSEDLLNQLKDYNGSGCPAPKPAPVKVKAEPKTCAPGQKLSRKGNCYTPKSQASVQQPQTRTVRTQQPRQREQVIIEEPQPRQRVVIQEQPVFSEPAQPQQPSLGQRLLGGAIVGGTVCILTGC